MVLKTNSGYHIHLDTNGQVGRHVEDMKQSIRIRAMQLEEDTMNLNLQRYLMAYRRAP